MVITSDSFARLKCPGDANSDFSTSCKGHWSWIEKDVELKYVGEVKLGLRDGKGKQQGGLFAGYDGDWVSDIPNGTGTWVYSEEREDIENSFGHRRPIIIKRIKPGYKYIGQVVNGKRHGQGILYDEKGAELSAGPWKENLDGKEREVAESMVFPFNSLCIAKIKKNYEYSYTDKYGRVQISEIFRMRSRRENIRPGWIMLPGEHQYGNNTVYAYIATLVRTGSVTHLNVYCVIGKDRKILGIESEYSEFQD